MTKTTILYLAFFIISILGFAQNGRSGNYDDITVRINPPIESSQRLSSYIHNTIWINSLRNDFEFLLDFRDCVDSTSTSLLLSINITLVSGTTWEVSSPPKQPFLFVFKYIFKSKSKDVLDRFNYVEFLSIWESKNKLPYEMIEKFVVCRDIIDRSGQKCASIEYEIVPEPIGKLKIVRREIKLPNKV